MGRRAVVAAAAPLHVRWLGRVAYLDAWALQQALFAAPAPTNHLLLLEHPHVFTLGAHATREHLLVDPAAVGAELHQVERGGDITYHGPGQLVGYPLLSLLAARGGSDDTDRDDRKIDGTDADRIDRGNVPAAQLPAGGMISSVAYVRSVEQLLIDALGDLGLTDVGRIKRYPGVWWRPDSSRPKKLAAVGVKLSRGRTMHGFALNVNCDLEWFDKIVPCGIKEFEVASLAAAGLDVTMEDVVDCVTNRAVELWGQAGWDRQDLPTGGAVNSTVSSSDPSSLSVLSESSDPSSDLSSNPPSNPEPDPSAATPRHRRKLEEAQVSVSLSLPYRERKPEWMKVKLQTGPDYWRLKQTMRGLNLTTVCEESGCPNISECWNDGTATFMINGERCTRACGFCLVDTSRPAPPDPQEPQNLARAIAQLRLDYAVITAVARDDLPDGGAAQFAECLRAVRRECPGTQVEVLIPDFKGDPAALAAVFAERPVVLNHNVETVLRLQRAVRPQASYARSLAVLGRAKAAGLVAKTSLIVGLGETEAELVGALADLAAVGVDIVTIGQYLRPSAEHLPVARWWEPAEFERLAAAGERLGIGHVEAGPLVRSSYRAAHSAAQQATNTNTRSRT